MWIFAAPRPSRKPHLIRPGPPRVIALSINLRSADLGTLIILEEAHHLYQKTLHHTQGDYSGCAHRGQNHGDNSEFWPFWGDLV